MTLLLAGCHAMDDEPVVSQNEAALEIENGLTTNALTLNALTLNALTLNALTLNALTLNGATEADIDHEKLLRADARRLLEYMYSCAMPAGASMEFTVSTEGEDGSTCDGGVLSPDGLTCSYGTLHGSLGVAPQWADGTCDASCQRWVSACVLARTNAYGVPVQLSLRGPNPAIDTVTPAETAAYPLREGAFFGNLFATTTAADGTLVAAPQYFACAGPASNLPSLTRRFCSSEADDCVIQVSGPCECMNNGIPCYASCSSSDPATGAEQDCAPLVSNPAGGLMQGEPHFAEVATVFLREPITFCGNDVCEAGETAASCAADCRAGSWAISETRTYDLNTLRDDPVGGLAVAPDGSLVSAVFAGASKGTSQHVEFLNRYSATDGTRTKLATIDNDFFSHIWPTAATVVNSTGDIFIASTRSRVFLAKYSAAGTPQFQHTWGGFGTDKEVPAALAVAPDDTVVMAGVFRGTLNLGGADLISQNTEFQTDVFVAKFDRDGQHVWSQRLAENQQGNPNWATGTSIDPAGNIAVTATFDYGRRSALISFAPDGQRRWTKSFGSPNYVSIQRVVTDSNGNITMLGQFHDTVDFGGGPVTTPSVYKQRFVVSYTADGAFRWQQISDGVGSTYFAIGTAIAADRDGGVFVADLFHGSPDFGGGPVEGAGNRADPVIVKYSASGAFAWAKTLPATYGAAIRGLAVDRGRVFVNGYFSGSLLIDGNLLVNAAPDLFINGSGFYPASFADDLFLGSFHDSCELVAEGTPCTDRIPPELTAIPSAVNVEATAAITPVAFTVAAADDLDGPLVPVCLPASGSGFSLGTTTVTCSATDAAGNLTTKSFTVRVSDTTAPQITVPGPISAVATSTAGATVTYSGVSATDAVGANLLCSPASGGQFPLGTISVTCQAMDPTGNFATKSFLATVNYATSVVAPAPNASFKRGATVKTTFKMTDASAPITNAIATLIIAPVVDGVVGPESSAGAFGYAKRSKDYSASLATRKLALGTWRLRIELNDGAPPRTVQITITP